jgi:protein involved in polysaccharide export with SLBB domain
VPLPARPRVDGPPALGYGTRVAVPARSHACLAALLAAALACGGLARTVREAPPASEDVPAASTLGPGDVVEIRVYQEPELSGLYQVGPEGDVVFPLCQHVPVSGLTPNGAAERLRDCLAAKYMRSPQVSVLVKEYNSKKVFVFGEVQKPGTFVFEDGMSIVQAVTLAGGFTKTAAQNSTSVTRRVNGQEVKVKVQVQDIALGRAPNFTLEPGDIVYVPESLF